MHMVRVIFSFWVSISLLFACISAFASDSENPYKIVQDVASATFERIKTEQGNIKQNPEVLRTIVEQELLPHIDYRFSSAKVLGKHFKNVSKEEFLQYEQVFRRYLITTYAIALTYYEDQKVEFEPIKEVGKDKNITVRAVVKDEGRPDIKIAFKVRKNSKTNQWKAYDMIAEGISMLSSKQSEFESILRQDGIGKIMQIMKETIEKPIQLGKAGQQS